MIIASSMISTCVHIASKPDLDAVPRAFRRRLMGFCRIASLRVIFLSSKQCDYMQAEAMQRTTGREAAAGCIILSSSSRKLHAGRQS